MLNDQFGSKTSRFEYLAYHFSPDRREIVVTSTRCVDYHYALPTRSAHLETTGTGRSSWKVRIPLDPVPDCLMRCRLIVETDPDAPLYESYNLGSFDAEVDGLPIDADETLHIRVRPDDLNFLSSPFRVNLIERNEASAPDADAAPDGTPVPKREGEVRIMFPIASDGNTYEAMTVIPREARPNPVRELISSLRATSQLPFLFPSSADYSRAFLERAADAWDAREAERYRYPFLEGQDEIRMIEYERIAGERFPAWDAVLWKMLWLPSAIVLDTVLLPVYVVYWPVAILFLYALGSGIQ